MTQKSLSAASWAGLLTLGLIWGGSFLAIAIALREVPVLTVVAIRVGGAAVFLWGVVLASGQRPPPGWRPWAGIAGMALIGNVVPFTLITWGQQHIASGLAAILNAATAIFGVLIAAAVFPDERLVPRKAAGVALGFLGVVIAKGLDQITRLDLTSLGQWALIGAAFCYGASSSWGRAMLHGVPPLISAAGMLTLSAFVMVPLALVQDGLPVAMPGLTVTLALLYLSTIASGLAYPLFYRVMASAGAGNTSLVTLLVAPVAIVLGALVLGEALPPQDYLGFAILALGLLVLDGRVIARLRRPAAGEGKPLS